MRKALKIFGISAGLLSVISAMVLGIIYFDDAVEHIKKLKN